MSALSLPPPSPLVSVLVPAYNAEPYLAECLASAVSQTYSAVEVVIVDDGSTDGTLAVAKGFEGRGVCVIAQENRGPCGARNAAFGAAKGEYIQFLDADDVLHPQKIEMQMKRLLAAEPTAMASGAWARFQSDISEAVFRPQGVWTDLDPVEWLVSSWSGGGMMHTAGWLIPRRVAVAAGPWVESRRWAANEDADFFTRALLASTRCLFCPEAKSFYRGVEGSQSNLRSRRSLEAALDVVIYTGEALLRAEDSERTRRAFANHLQIYAYSTFPDGSDLVSKAERRIRELGGADLGPKGFFGPTTYVLSGWLGWKTAARLRRLAGGIR